MQAVFNPEYVLSLTKPTESFLCPLNANTFGINFQKFKIRNIEDNETILEICNGPTPENFKLNEDDNKRKVKYELPRQFLQLKEIGSTVEFKVGPQPVTNFRMIERHYLGDKLIKSFDFTFGFCIANSVNSWEFIYEMPHFSKQEIDEIVKNPWKVKSDSFYFNENAMIMHHKAEYMYYDN